MYETILSHKTPNFIARVDTKDMFYCSEWFLKLTVLLFLMSQFLVRFLFEIKKFYRQCFKEMAHGDDTATSTIIKFCLWFDAPSLRKFDDKTCGDSKIICRHFRITNHIMFDWLTRFGKSSFPSRHMSRNIWNVTKENESLSLAC